MKKTIKTSKLPTLKQKRVINGVLENLGKEKPDSYGKILDKAGYSKAIVKNPKQIMESKTIQEGIQPFIEELDKKRKMALQAITPKKLAESNAKDLSYVTNTLTKNHQLLTGGITENLKGEISLSKLYDEASKEDNS